MTIETIPIPKSPENFRIILLPDTEKSETYKCIDLEHPVTHQSAQFLISTLDKTPNICQLNKIDFKDDHNLKQRFTKDSKPLNSILLTKSNDSDTASEVNSCDDALVLGDKPEIYIAGKFNVVYFLLDFFISYLQKETLRILTYDDLLELLSDNNDGLSKLIELNIRFTEALNSICETIVENDETFYKISTEKITQYLKVKITKMIEKFPKSLEEKITRPLNSKSITLTDEVLNLCKIKQSIDLLTTFVGNFYLDLLRKEWDFSILEQHIQELKKMDHQLSIAEENLNMLNNNLINEKTNKRKITENKKKPKVDLKKPKVAAGKGALDMFFKKK